MQKALLCLLFWSIFWLNYGQINEAKHESFSIPKRISIELQNAPGWKFSIQNQEMPFPDNGSYRGHLMGLRQNFVKPITPKLLDTFIADTPIIASYFQGNGFAGGTPPDNALAISDDNYLISSINSEVKAYHIYDNDSVPEMILNISLANFCDTLGLSAHKYDPKLIYDPDEHKFIFIFLIGSLDSSNYIVCAFSSSSNPSDPWHIYALPGNPLDNKCWSDYPALGLSNNDLFITTNQIITDSSWQSGFNGSTIWQINKESGFSGDSLQSYLWHDIKYDGKFIRNLHPVNGAKKSYGDKMYFLSNRNFDIKNDSIFLLSLSGAIGEDSLDLSVNCYKMDTPYGVPPVARQVNDHTFETNDSRVLGSFLLDDKIHFVGNTMNFETNTASIYHGQLQDLEGKPFIKGKIFTDTLDWGYPNISYSGKYEGDDEALISFLHSGPNTFSGSSCMFYDKFLGYSKPIIVKKGSYLVNTIGGTYERWGDYTGSQRKYNEDGIVWISGSYGQKKEGGFIDQYFSSTWIYKAISPDTSMSDPVFIPDSMQFSAYPNPVEEWFSCQFDLDTERNLNISVFDFKGKLIKVLLDDVVEAGYHHINFQPNGISKGVYFLRVIDKNQILFSYKFIKL